MSAANAELSDSCHSVLAIRLPSGLSMRATGVYIGMGFSGMDHDGG